MGRRFSHCSQSHFADQCYQGHFGTGRGGGSGGDSRSGQSGLGGEGGHPSIGLVIQNSNVTMVKCTVRTAGGGSGEPVAMVV